MSDATKFSQPHELIVPDADAMMQLGAQLARRLTAGMIIYLSGQLGAGKTTLMRGLLQALGHSRVKSPTYTLVESYLSAEYQIHHFDLYRISDPNELDFIGLQDYLAASAICVFEWAELGATHLPPPDLLITIQVAGTRREVTLQAKSACGEQVLAAL